MKRNIALILAAVLGVTIDEILVTDGDETNDGMSDKDSLAITGITVQW